MGKYRKIFHYSKHGRDIDDPLYVKWRKEVKQRDNHTCQFPGCGFRSVYKIQAHHIKPWAKFPTLRYMTLNGICLCRKCHELIKGKEQIYEPIFIGLAIRNHNGKNNGDKGHA